MCRRCSYVARSMNGAKRREEVERERRGCSELRTRSRRLWMTVERTTRLLVHVHTLCKNCGIFSIRSCASPGSPCFRNDRMSMRCARNSRMDQTGCVRIHRTYEKSITVAPSLYCTSEINIMIQDNGCEGINCTYKVRLKSAQVLRRPQNPWE